MGCCPGHGWLRLVTTSVVAAHHQLCTPRNTVVSPGGSKDRVLRRERVPSEWTPSARQEWRPVACPMTDRPGKPAQRPHFALQSYLTKSIARFFPTVGSSEGRATGKRDTR